MLAKARAHVAAFREVCERTNRTEELPFYRNATKEEPNQNSPFLTRYVFGSNFLGAHASQRSSSYSLTWVFRDAVWKEIPTTMIVEVTRTEKEKKPKSEEAEMGFIISFFRVISLD